MGQRFGHDFSAVRVHTDSEAARSAAAMKARAYTVGTDIVFGNGEYRPSTGAGRSLIAHELAHVLQNRIAAREGKRPEGRSSAAQPSERQASSAANAVMRGESVGDWRFHPAESRIHAVDVGPTDPAEAYIIDEPSSPPSSAPWTRRRAKLESPACVTR